MKVDKFMLEFKEEIKFIDYYRLIVMESYCRIFEYFENIGEIIINMVLS